MGIGAGKRGMVNKTEKKKIPALPAETFFGGNLRGIMNNGPRYLAKTANLGDIVSMRFGPNKLYLISSPEYIKEILVTRASDYQKAEVELKIMGRSLGRGLVTNNGSFHRKQRRLLQPAFVPSRVNSYSGIIMDYTRKLLDSWEDGQSRDLAIDMTDLTMYIAAHSLFNADVSREARQAGDAIAEIQHATHAEFTRGFIVPQFIPIENNRRMRNATSSFDDLIYNIINDRMGGDRFKDHKDILSILLKPDDESGELMDIKQIRDEVATLFAAGHETTSNALTWTFYLLAKHQDIQDRLHEEIKAVLGDRPPTLEDLDRLVYTGMVFNESMRVYPPVWVLNARQAAKTMELDGYKIKKGQFIMISPYAMHHQERYFPRPEKFDPERFSPENEGKIGRYEYIPFGAGPRVCIGNSFALMEGRLILAAIIGKFRLKMAPGAKVEMLAQITLSPRYGMPMVVERREPGSV